MLQKLDTWLIDRFYQGLVDWSQRKPCWWVEQCAATIFVTSIMRFLLDVHSFGSYFILGIDLVFASVFYWYSKQPAQLFSLGKIGFLRATILIITLVGLPLDLLYLLVRHNLAYIFTMFYDFAFMSVYYFAACKPPSPKKQRQTKLVTSPGAA